MRQLSDAIVSQAEIFFYRHEQLFSGVADTIPVDDNQAVNGAIGEMFPSEFFTSLQKTKLYRRLHQELWPEGELPPLHRKHHAKNVEIKLKVIDELCRRLRRRIPDYVAIITDRREFARELSIHPVKMLAQSHA